MENLSFFSRAIHYVRCRILKWLGHPTPSRYVPHRRHVESKYPLNTGYLLIDYIDESQGRMLSETWADGRHDAKLRNNFFHSLSRIILAISQTPLPKIGSFVLDERGYLSLSNRPLTLDIHQLENEGIPVDIPRSLTYSTADSYINDILAFHESRFRHQPNAVFDEKDGLMQASALMLVRSAWSCFFRRDLLRGPFVLSLTDLHQSNILVDDNWNITYLIDLEWACSRPVEMVRAPFWLSGQVIDGITKEEYELIHTEFMQAFAEEEAKINELQNRRPSMAMQLHSILQQGWDNGSFWCSLALDSPTGLFALFFDHIQPRFSKSDPDKQNFWSITTNHWKIGAMDFIQDKLKEKADYDLAVRKAFEAPEP